MFDTIKDTKVTKIATTIVDGKYITVSEAGVATADTGAIISATAPEGITSETIKTVQEYTKAVHSATLLALGHAAAPAFAANPELKSVLGEFTWGHDVSALEIARSKVVPAGLGADAGTREVFGYVQRGAYTSHAGQSGACYKQVKAAVSSMVSEALGINV